MEYYFAPLEGVTGYVLRNAHRKYFPGIDKYFIPFIAAQKSRRLKAKERADVSPWHNQDMAAIPQVLTKDAEDFLAVARILQGLGYREVNLNLGCPSPTVASKGKGAGMLRDLGKLERFLDRVFDGAEGIGVSVSIKTRIGCDSEKEAQPLFGLYSRYPVSELIVHPRTLLELYKGKPHREAFYAILGRGESPFPFVYNGDICSKEDQETLLEGLPAESGRLKAIMCGRGLIANPALVRELSGGPPLSLGEIFDYHNEIYEGLRATLQGPVPPLSKMKELWWYMRKNFPEKERAYLNIKKADNFREYEAAVRELFFG